jgi:hypothetical protein
VAGGGWVRRSPDRPDHRPAGRDVGWFSRR